MTTHMCIACQSKRITYRFALCTNCEKKYGKSALGWPDWLRFLWNDLQRERRRERKLRQHEVLESDLVAQYE